MTTAGDRSEIARVRARHACVLAPPTVRGTSGRTTTHRDRREVIALPICRRCGWPRGGPGCRAAHGLNPAARMWSRREWLRYRRTGRLPAWDYTSRRDRRRIRRGR
jgi:hypothetical protein